MTLAERINLWLLRWRRAGRPALLSRVVILVAGVVALVVSALPSWDQADAVPVVGVALLVLTILLPDTPVPLLFIGVVAAGWLYRAPAEPAWDVAVLAASLVAVHLGSAYAAQIPLATEASPTTVRRWLLPATIGLVAGPLVAIASALVRRADVPGALAVTIAAAAAVALTTWYAASPYRR
jgi:hypothetical protein